MNLPGSFEYLARENQWPGFTLGGIESGPDGHLTLAHVARLTESVQMGDIGGLPTPDAAVAGAPAGVAITQDGDCVAFVSEPARSLIWRFDACDPQPKPLVSVRGPGTGPGETHQPRGLAIAPYSGGQRLFVADSANHRILVIDIETQQPLAIWGQADPFGVPAASSEPGCLNEPWALAADRGGSLYVVDHGNARVQKFAPSGAAVPSFAEALTASAAAHPVEPLAIAVGGDATSERVYVLDRDFGGMRVLVYDTDGRPAGPISWDVEDGDGAIALAVTQDSVYVAKTNGVIIKCNLSGGLMSSIPSGAGLIAALAPDCDGALLGATGGPLLLRFRADSEYLTRGWFMVGPLETTARPIVWRRLHVEASIQAGSHFQLHTYTSHRADAMAVPGDGAEPFGDVGWYAQPIDEAEVLVLGKDARDALAASPPALPDDLEREIETTYFWVGGVLWGDGQTSPSLRQIRVDHQPKTAAEHLPAIYREGPRRRLPAELILAALDTELGRVDSFLEDMPALFDPWAAPVDWLPWLASWLEFALVEDWSEQDKRSYISEAMALYGRRGTIDGLRRCIEIYAGVTALIEEPAAQAALFILDEEVSLGFNTMLAPAHELGAIVGSTATLGQSHLISPEEVGVPLFSDVVNRFAVRVYAGQVQGERRRRLLEQAIERERPAHTEYHLCVIDAQMRVGVQSRLGVDSIVAGPPPDLRLGDETGLGIDTALANQPPRSRRIGAGARVGGVI